MTHPRLIALVLLLAAIAWRDADPQAQAARRDRPFVAYLQSPSAALVAFNPTNYDPRPGRAEHAPTGASIAADVTALRPAFDGLILYGYDERITPIVLAEMRRAQFRAVLLGVWDPKSRDEVLAVAALANEYGRSLAVGVCVGNEGIAFNRYQFQDVVAASGLLTQNLHRPEEVALCTSEPLSEYGWAPLRDFGDFIAANIHPVFDRPELGPVEAVRWVRERATTLADTAMRAVLVKETGFPHGQKYTPRLQADFWGEYVERGSIVRTARGNIWISFAAAFEAFDLPWKAEQSGIAIEDSWGLLSTARASYPAFTVWAGRQRARQQR